MPKLLSNGCRFFTFSFHSNTFYVHLTTIRLKDFKNYEDIHLDFNAKIVCFTGSNGVGKTNLLDAIHYISMTKSYFHRTDRYSVRENSTGFMIDAEVNRNGEQESFTLDYKPGRGKNIYVNDSPLRRFSEHIGRWPCTFIAPDDKQLLYDGSIERRRFMNMSLSQMDNRYIVELQRYNKILRQRNKTLKDMAETRRWDKVMIDSFDKQFEEPAAYIKQARRAFAERLSSRFSDLYQRISGKRERMECHYESPLENISMYDLLQKNREKDRALERTSSGLHKDDLKVKMDGKPAEIFGSQGQLKSFVIALKLTQFFILKESCGVTPFVLLDDLFEKVDEMRLTAIVELVNEISEGQVFITDTDADRVMKLLHNIDASVEFYDVKDNQIQLIN